jgi:hypothetical protein
MIKYIKRQDLDVVKYDKCIDASLQSRIYAFSWYLDIVADNWGVLVLGNYQAVMPVPIRKKYGIKYVYPPFWLLQLGVFSSDINQDIKPFLTFLFDKFKSVELRLNTKNLKFESRYLISKQMQYFALDNSYSSVFESYRKDRRKDLKKASNQNLTEKWNDNPEKLITLFKNNVGKRTPYIVDKDYVNLLKLINECIKNRVGEVLSIYDAKNNLVASGFFLKNNGEVTILVSSTDFKNRKNGANTYLIDRAIYKYQKNFEVFNFGGSSMLTIANYFLSFGGFSADYQQIKYNNLPFLLKLFKK